MIGLYAFFGVVGDEVTVWLRALEDVEVIFGVAFILFMVIICSVM